MPPRKVKTKETTPPPAAGRASALLQHPLVQFPLVVASSLVLSSVLYSLVAQVTPNSLGSVSRSLQNWWEVVALIAWRATELGIGWWSNYDGVDLASLTLLSHLPPLHLLSNFYSIPPTTILLSLAIDLLSTYLPFRLFRPLSPVHHLPATHAAAVPNQPLLSSLPIRTLTTLLPSAIYAVVLFGSYHTFLPIHLVTHFAGIRSLSAAHGPNLVTLIATSLPIGWAAREYLFATATGSRSKTTGRGKKDDFDPVEASFLETVRWNFWGWDERTRQLIVRTATLVGVTAVHTWVQLYVTVEGVEGVGAAGYAAVWAAAGGLVGAMFAWIGHV